jgi:hypothetical protein
MSCSIARQSLLRDRPPFQYRVVAFWADSQRVASRQGDLRLRPRSHHVRLSVCEFNQNCVGRLQRGSRRVQGLRSPCHHVVPLHEHPGTLCTGYLGDIGVPPDPAPMDFSALFEVYLGDHWYTLDARHDKPRIGRILMARGRDATDVAIVTSFGPCTLTNFKVFTDGVT